MKSSRRLRPRISRRSSPRKRMAPLVGASVFRIMRASVVLPLPDSPMIARISGSPRLDREADVVDGIEMAAAEESADGETAW